MKNTWHVIMAIVLTISICFTASGCFQKPSENVSNDASSTTTGAADEKLTFLSKRGYVNDDKCPVVIGEVKNSGGYSINDIVLKAGFYCSSGKLIGEKEEQSAIILGSTEIEILSGGETSPFKIALTKEEIKELPNFDISKLENFTVDVTSFYATDKVLYRSFEVTNTSGGLDKATGEYKLAGDVKNTGNEASDTTKVIATFYDNQPKIIEVLNTMVAPLSPGDETKFTITVVDKEVSKRIDRYSIQVVKCEKCN